jgi:hypothetical protein
MKVIAKLTDPMSPCLKVGQIYEVDRVDEDRGLYHIFHKERGVKGIRGMYKWRFEEFKEEYKYLIVSLLDGQVEKQITPLLTKEKLEERINKVSHKEEIVAIYKLETTEFNTSKKYTLV